MGVLIYRLLLLLSTEPEHKTNFHIARTMLKHYDKIGFYSIDDMAVLCTVSKSTLSKFAKAIGFDNYIALKDASGFIENRYENDLDFLSNIIKPIKNDGPQDYFKAIEQDIQSFNTNLDYSTIDQLANDLMSYEKVSAFGLLFSGTAASDLQMKLAYNKKFIYTTMNELEQEKAIAQADADSLIIIFSNSGKYVTQKQFLKDQVRKTLFQNTHAKIVLITSNENMKSHENVDVCINFQNTTHFQTYSIMYQIIIDLIVSRYRYYLESDSTDLHTNLYES